ncbi:protein phosphatase CheZ [Telmatospirillum sp.]|uniref:protein phosphatase CheZ n=1 Tax=Telmatospirillum sp. TaxID=2079197 RepID=UPI00284575CA|nr:protein phosphatase CheZ [Telmatospirillum sp.]MDR3437598.1 protein phosphatase CheZ [Telmatospirillum sp.]
MISTVEEDQLKKELVGLFGHMNKMRRELAVLQGHDDGNFVTMADTLDAIVENTETASNAILESMESIEEMVSELRRIDNPAVSAICSRISERSNQVFEACSFQDLTGQRITRVVNSLKFIEERVTAMVRMWGKEELAKVVEEVKAESAPAVVDPDKALLHGPQRDSVANSQADVDKLFSQDDIDKLFG